MIKKMRMSIASLYHWFVTLSSGSLGEVNLDIAGAFWKRIQETHSLIWVDVVPYRRVYISVNSDTIAKRGKAHLTFPTFALLVYP